MIRKDPIIRTINLGQIFSIECFFFFFSSFFLVGKPGKQGKQGGLRSRNVESQRCCLLARDLFSTCHSITIDIGRKKSMQFVIHKTHSHPSLTCFISTQSCIPNQGTNIVYIVLSHGKAREMTENQGGKKKKGLFFFYRVCACFTHNTNIYLYTKARRGSRE